MWVDPLGVRSPVGARLRLVWGAPAIVPTYVGSMSYALDPGIRAPDISCTETFR